MNIKKALAVNLGISAVALFAAACSTGEAATNEETQQPQSAAPAVTVPSNQTLPTVGAPVAPAKFGPVAAAQVA